VIPASARIASAIFIRRGVALAIGSGAISTTSAPVSATQSCPAIPRSKWPSSMYRGISCGRITATLEMRGSSIEAW
jgi:hypothetical protein